MRALLVATMALGLLAFPAEAFSARQTTNPGLAPIALYITLTDKGVKYTMWQITNDEGHQGLLVANSLQRGEAVFFYVTNKGKRPHSFKAFGKKTAMLKHGAKARFKVALLHRGKFHWSSTPDAAKPGFSGIFRVY